MLRAQRGDAVPLFASAVRLFSLHIEPVFDQFLNVLFKSGILNRCLTVAEGVTDCAEIQGVQITKPLLHVDILCAILKHHYQLHFGVRDVTVAEKQQQQSRSADTRSSQR